MTGSIKLPGNRKRWRTSIWRSFSNWDQGDGHFCFFGFPRMSSPAATDLYPILGSSRCWVPGGWTPTLGGATWHFSKNFSGSIRSLSLQNFPPIFQWWISPFFNESLNFNDKSMSPFHFIFINGFSWNISMDKSFVQKSPIFCPWRSPGLAA